LRFDGRQRLDLTLAWARGHKQRLLYGLAAFSLVGAVTAATVGGILLHRAANVERQALRTQELASAVAELQDFPAQIEARGATAQLAARRKKAQDTANQLFRNVRAHDGAESDRIRAAYLAYVRASTLEFNRASASGLTSPRQRGRTERELSRFEARISIESRRLAATAHDTNPEARLALILAVVAAALLVALLVWQFEVQRRAGRIDRDNLARSQELSRLREALVATVSHELRTPLTSIIGYLDLIMEDTETSNLTSEQSGFLSVVQRNADRLLDVVGDLLLVAEADGGRLALDLQEVDLDALATTCVESAQPAADARQIELTLNRGPTTRIQGDPNRLGQMMDNLVSNAIKFTPVGGRVAVRTASTVDLALFEVSDTGPGISVPDQAHLFDRFFRTRTAIDQAVKGTGLGLAITKAIVDAHQGTITVESALGSHTTFRVQLPAT
jgi:signal transduction histidine kinase